VRDLFSLRTVLYQLKAQMKPILLITLTVAAVAAQGMPREAASLLTRHAGFTEHQIAAVRRGERVVRALPTACQEEVAFAGATRLPIPLSDYLQRLRAGTLYRAGDNVIRIGRFSDTPTAADLEALGFESYDLQSGPPAEAAERNRRALISWIEEYQKSGETGTGPLGERPRTVDRAKRFVPLVTQSGYLRETMPPAYDHLLGYPSVPKRGRNDFFIWKQLSFGLRPLTRVAHVSIWEKQNEAFVVTKQIYANRYFDASYQIDHLVSDGGSVYLITLNYGRSELLGGISGRLARPVVVARTVALAGKTLDRARRELQHP
jgi:hypothetical protein